jgi:hypothetical protein
MGQGQSRWILVWKSDRLTLTDAGKVKKRLNDRKLVLDFIGS